MQQTLKAAREKKKLSFAQLAKLSGVHKATVARIERGEVSPLHETVVALEDAMDLKRGTLTFGEQAVA